MTGKTFPTQPANEPTSSLKMEYSRSFGSSALQRFTIYYKMRLRALALGDLVSALLCVLSDHSG